MPMKLRNNGADKVSCGEDCLHYSLFFVKLRNNYGRLLFILNVLCSETLRQFRFFNIFKFKNAHKNKQRRHDKCERYRTEEDANPGHDHKKTRQHRVS